MIIPIKYKWVLYCCRPFQSFEICGWYCSILEAPISRIIDIEYSIDLASFK